MHNPPPPRVTCNNLETDFDVVFLLKLYSHKESEIYPSYQKQDVLKACEEACSAQYQACIGTYATGCGSKGYDEAKGKCSDQCDDRVKVNNKVSAEKRCSSFGKGWS